MPDAIPVTIPVVSPTVATPVVPLAHVPPATASPSVVVLPTHTCKVPVIAESAFTVTIAVVVQPAGVVYIIVVVPFAMALTTPVVKPMVATPTVLLFHVPPPTASESVVLLPAHNANVPVIGANGFTVTTAEAVQPAAVVYTMVDVPPATPVTTPVPTPMVATPVVPLFHVPPPAASASVVVLPWHTLSVPVIADIGFTVTIALVVQPAGVV